MVVVLYMLHHFRPLQQCFHSRTVPIRINSLQKTYLISPFIYNSSFLLVKFPISYQIELAHVDIQLRDFVVDNFVVCPDRVYLFLHPVNFILSVLDRVLVRTLDHVHLRLERNRLFFVFAFQVELNLFGQL
jgi:hypothetical protein